MSKVITITLSDEKYKEHRVEVSEILDYAVYLEADVTIRDAPKYASGGVLPSLRLTEPV